MLFTRAVCHVVKRAFHQKIIYNKAISFPLKKNLTSKFLRLAGVGA